MIGLGGDCLHSLLFEGFGTSLCCCHLHRRCLAEIDVHNLVFVLIFLTGEELHEAGVGVLGGFGWSGPAWTLPRKRLLDICNVSSAW